MTDTTTDDAVDDFTDDDSTTDDSTTDDATQGKPEEDELGDAGKKALDRMKAERAAANKRVKDLEKELDTFKRASMTETEKAIQEAKLEGRKGAFDEFGAKLARSTFDTLAAKRNPDVETDDIVEFLDMKRFLSEDGDIDDVALQSAVDRLVPAPTKGPPSQDGGVRRTNKPTDMNAIIRGQARGGRSA